MRDYFSQELPVHGVQLKRMTVDECAEEGARCGRGADPAKQSRYRTVAQKVQATDAVRACGPAPRRRSLWRNMAAMATEEMLRANPIDGVVLLGGCDKTIPSLLMAAASVDLPAVVVPGGPMLTGTFRGTPLGCGTDVWRLSEEVRAGTLSQEQFTRSESAMIRSRGHCNTMGTASTMALVAEALGMVLPGTAGIPAPDSRLLEAAHHTGRLAVDMVAADRRPGSFLTEASFHNAIVALAAVGGSTNAVVHLLAIAGRLGVDLSLDDIDRIGSRVPVLVDLQPAGRFLMEDLHRAAWTARRPARGAGPARSRRADRHRQSTGRVRRRRFDLGRRCHPHARRADGRRGRRRRTARQPRSGRRAHQTGRRLPAVAQASRPGRRLRLHRGLPRPHRRPGTRCRRRFGSRPARLRPQGLPGDARGLEHATAEEAA